MDLYRYFHPHHNPRLRNVPLRLQELAELQQAASEFRKALKRAEIRTDDSSCELIDAEHFSKMIEAVDYILDMVSKLTDKHPGDDLNQMKKMIEERKDAPGWENWTRLLGQRIISLENSSAKKAINS